MATVRRKRMVPASEAVKPKRGVRYVTDYGLLYRLNAERWKLWLDHKAAGGNWGVGHFGTAVGVVTDVTEWTAETAKTALEAK